MSRIKLWEDTVVIAIRDLQWRRSIRNNEAFGGLAPTIPPGFVKLDGKTESRLGDLALKEDVRYFLIEVKAERAAIRDEWHTNSASGEKLVLQRLRTIVDEANNASLAPQQSASTEHSKLIELSLRGHHFAFWEGQALPTDPSQIRGAIGVTPYLIGAAAERSLADGLAGLGLDRLPDAYVFRSTNPLAKTTKEGPAAGLQAFFSEKTELARLKGASAAEVFRLGLDKDEFKTYVDFLCADAGQYGEPVHAIILSTAGFFRVISDTNHLADFLDVALVPERELRRRQAELAKSFAQGGQESPT
jgi:hypothetical protein